VSLSLLLFNGLRLALLLLLLLLPPLLFDGRSGSRAPSDSMPVAPRPGPDFLAVLRLALGALAVVEAAHSAHQEVPGDFVDKSRGGVSGGEHMLALTFPIGRGTIGGEVEVVLRGKSEVKYFQISSRCCSSSGRSCFRKKRFVDWILSSLYVSLGL